MTMNNYQRAFGAGKPVIGMKHFGALPGTPLYDETVVKPACLMPSQLILIRGNRHISPIKSVVL